MLTKHINDPTRKEVIKSKGSDVKSKPAEKITPDKEINDNKKGGSK